VRQAGISPAYTDPSCNRDIDGILLPDEHFDIFSGDEIDVAGRADRINGERAEE
jgi:hypothetical protein